jgi:hypothetical protein
MYFKNLLTKSLLVVAMLGVGASNSWAVDYPYNVGTSTSDVYGTAFSPEYTLTGNGQVEITFTNYRQTDGNYWNNWVLMCATSDEVSPTVDLTNKVFTVRSDWYDDKAGSNTSFTSGAGYTNADFCTFQNEATVNIRITRVGTVVTVFTTVSKNEETRWMSYYKTGVTAGTLKFYLTQQLSYLTITSEPTINERESSPVFSQDYEGDDDAATGWTINGKSGYTHSFTKKTESTNHYGQLYSNVNASRNAYWNFGTASSLSDNWNLSFKFKIGTISGTNFSVIGDNSTIPATTANTSNVYLGLNYNSTNENFDVIVGTTDITSPVDLATGTWYTATVSLLDADKASSYLSISITDGASLNWSTTQKVDGATIGELKGLFVLHGKNGTINFDDIVVTKKVNSGSCENPTIAITDFDGDSRSFTLSCVTDASTIYWSETEKAIGDAGWTEYTGEASTSVATIFAYAATATANSAVVALATEAGSSIQLNTPTILRTGAQTYTITAKATAAYNQTATQTIHYTINGGAEQTSSSPANLTNVDGDIVAWTTASKFADSEETSMTYVAAIATTCDEWSYNLNSYPSSKSCTAIADAIDDSKTIEISEVTYYNLKGIDCPNLYVSNSSVWMLRNQATAAWKAQNSGTDAKIVIANVKTTDVISFSIGLDNGKSYGVTVTNATLQYSYNNSEYFYVPTADGNVILTMPSLAGMAINTIKVSTNLSNVSATLDNAGYATFASAYPLDLTTANLPAGVTAYKAVVVGTTAKFTALNQTVPANTGILLKGEASTSYNIPVVASGTEVTDNEFLVNEAGTTFDAADGYYYFAMKKNEATLTFATFAPSTLAFPANKAYLKVAQSNFSGGARLNVTFDEGETTGVEAIENSQLTIDNSVYDLQGRRVATPTRGLYIVNGKKVVIK